MKLTVYLETTIPSYLTAELSRDLLTAGHQSVTREWWDARRSHFELYVSEIVIQEARGGDQRMARKRLEVMAGIPALGLTQASRDLAKELVARGALPRKAAVDALHIAIASVSGMEFLLTWNCAHIANAALRPRIDAMCRAHGLEPPVICTPEELME